MALGGIRGTHVRLLEVGKGNGGWRGAAVCRLHGGMPRRTVWQKGRGDADVMGVSGVCGAE